MQRRYIIRLYITLYFAAKFNNNLCFYVNYRKFIAIIKRNHYLNFFIEKFLIKIINYKFLTKCKKLTRFNL